jgi:hypothetical protein
MSETLIPTMDLRFVERRVPDPLLPDHAGRLVRVLQQRFERLPSRSPSYIWQDVPLVSDEGAV